MKKVLIHIRNQVHYLATKEIKVLLAVLMIIGGSFLFIQIADEVSEGTTQEFDEWVLTTLRSADDLETPRGPDWVHDVMRDITALGGGTTLILITVFVSLYLILRKEYGALLLVLVASVGGLIIEMSLKEMFGRERPTVVIHLVTVGSLSFPSGHSMMSAVVYLTQASLLARIQTTKLIRIYIISIALFLSMLIGLSRIYLGVHYPTDVLAGWSVGLAWASLCWFVAWYFQRRSLTRKIEFTHKETEKEKETVT